MEEHNSSPNPLESAATLSASALRELQQRAHSALASSREQAARLEAQINQQLEAISASLSQQLALDSQSGAEAEAIQGEIARLTEELDSSRAAWLAERAELESQRDAASQKLEGAEAEREKLTKELSSAEVTRGDLTRKLTELEIEREILSQKVTKFAAQSDDVSPKLSNLETERENLSLQVTSLEAEKVALAEKITGLEVQRDDLTAKVAHLEAQRDELIQVASNYEAQRNELTQTVANLEAQIHSSQADWKNQLLDFEGRLREQQTSWVEQRSEWAAARAGLECERDELQQKFDLALEDLQRLRARGAELEQELARRPEANQTDSAELVALRAERDDLAARVEQLEQRPAANIDPNVEQQLADLQRRFELAVEDLREYKTKNAKLESQLAAASSQSRSAVPDTGGNDWESQKRRMLAALEEGTTTPETPVQKQQRITIEGTIEMTDAVVAEKDRQIADLQAQLATGGATGDAEHSRKINEMIDADEVIAEHRGRVRELEREMQEKLRAAELELSVERAKMARQRMELDDLKSNLESKRQEFESSGGVTTTPGQPKRRWRDKLGLSGDE